MVYVSATVLAVAFAALADSMRRVTRRSANVGSGKRERPDAVRPAKANPGAGAFVFLAGAALAAVGSLRWRVGVDYWNYEAIYWLWLDETWDRWTLFSEPGLRLISQVGTLWGRDPAIMFAMVSVLITWLVVRTLNAAARKSADTSLALGIVLFVVTGPWFSSFNGIRQFVACAIVFAGHRFILERRLGAYSLAVLVAGLFHVSAFVLLLLYWVPRRRVSGMTAALLLVAGALSTGMYDVFIQVVDSFRPGVAEMGAGSYVTQSVHPLRIAVAMAPFFLYVFFSPRDDDPVRGFYGHMLLLHAAVFLASVGSAYVARYAMYTSLFLLVALPLILPREPRTRAALLMLLLGLYTAFTLIEVGGTPSLRNYRWIFER